MKLKDYAKEIAALAKQYPNADVVCSKDDEGNGFQLVSYSPSAGRFENREWLTENDVAESKQEINAVCVN